MSAILKAMFAFLYNYPQVRAALSALVSAILLGAIAWVQSPEAKALLGSGAWLVQLFAPSIMDSKKPAQVEERGAAK